MIWVVVGIVGLLAYLTWVNLSGHRPAAPVRAEAVAPAGPLWLEGDGEFSLEVVGESFYQAVLEDICGGKTDDGVQIKVEVELVLEDDNPHDSKAVGVYILGQKVGHLSREYARALRSMLVHAGRGDRRARCRGLVTGGWRRERRGTVDEGHFGVRLDVI